MIGSMRKIFKAGVLAQEGQTDFSDRAVSLFGDDDFGDVVGLEVGVGQGGGQNMPSGRDFFLRGRAHITPG